MSPDRTTTRLQSQLPSPAEIVLGPSVIQICAGNEIHMDHEQVYRIRLQFLRVYTQLTSDMHYSCKGKHKPIRGVGRPRFIGTIQSSMQLNQLQVERDNHSNVTREGVTNRRDVIKTHSRFYQTKFFSA